MKSGNLQCVRKLFWPELLTWDGVAITFDLPRVGGESTS